MPVISLTTDWGIKDHYVGAFKGALLKAIPTAQLADISNLIPPHNLLQASYIFRNSWKAFPDNTIHIVAIDTNDKPGNSILAIEHLNHFFIGFDSGLFSLVFDHVPDQVFSIDKTNRRTSAVLVDVAKAIAFKTPLNEIGKQIDSYFVRTLFVPTIDQSNIVSKVIYVDDYSNIVTNVEVELFERVRNGRSFSIQLRHSGDAITRLSKSYDEVQQGEVAAIINESGYVEIGINGGKASQLLNLKYGDNIRIEFYDNTNRKADYKAHALS